MTDFDGRSSHLWSLRQRKARRTTPEMLPVGSKGIKRSAWPAHPVQIPSTANIFMPMSSMTNTSAGHPNKAVTRQFRVKGDGFKQSLQDSFYRTVPAFGAQGDDGVLFRTIAPVPAVLAVEGRFQNTLISG